MPFGIGKRIAENLPPGSMGWPLLGEALAYGRSPHKFIESRAARYGPVFKTRILRSKVICFVGPGPFAYFSNGTQFDRAGAVPDHVQELLCHESLPLLDGPAHASMKSKVSQAFTPSAIGSYLAIADRLLRSYIERWEGLGEFAWSEECKLFVAGLCSRLLLGEESGFEDDKDLSEILDGFIAGVTAFPINLPFSTYGKAVRRRNELLNKIDRAIEGHLVSAQENMLSRLLEAIDEHGEPLTRYELRAQMVHLFFAAYGGLSRAVALLYMDIGQRPEVKKNVEEELADLSTGSGYDIPALMQLEYLQAVTRETRRHNRLFASNFFDNVTESFSFMGYEVPAGWKATGAMYQTMQDGSRFEQPDRFDPDRFLSPRDEHEVQPTAYIPHGGGPPSGHRCPAEDLTTLLMQQAVASVATTHGWELIPGQDISLTGGASPMPRDGIRVHLYRKTKRSCHAL